MNVKTRIGFLAGLIFLSGCASPGQRVPAGDEHENFPVDVVPIIPATEAEKVVFKLLPSYQLQISTLAEIIYHVPTSRLRPFVPAPYHIENVLGTSTFVVLIAHYTHSFSLSTGNDGQAYDEISYLTQVDYNGVKGNYFSKLHLNSRAGWILGRSIYGFPKDLANLEVNDAPNSLSVYATALNTNQKLGTFEFEKTVGMVRPLARSEGWVAKTIQKHFDEAFFVKGSNYLSAKFNISIPVDGAHRLILRRAELPYAVSAGLVDANEVQHPDLALYFDKAQLRIDSPEILNLAK